MDFEKGEQLKKHYFLPQNFTNYGRFLGIFEMRSLIKASIAVIPIILLLVFLPISLKVRVYIGFIFIPIVGFVLAFDIDKALRKIIAFYKNRRLIYRWKGKGDSNEKSYYEIYWAQRLKNSRNRRA